LKGEVALIYSDRYLGHQPPLDHPERPNRLIIALEALKSMNLLQQLLMVEPLKAVEEEVTIVHNLEYVRMVRDFSRIGGGLLDSDTYIVEDTYDVALLAVGGVLKGLRDILSNRYSKAFVLARPPGHHVGFKGRALNAPTQGFCLFNNIAIGAKHLLNYGFERIAIVNIDCHHGNGTQEIFYKTPNILYISMHQDPETLYPGTGFLDEIGEEEGVGYNVNIPLPPGSGDDVCLEVIREVISPILNEFKPEIILVSAGFDGYKGEPLGDLNITSYGYAQLFNTLIDIAERYSKGRILAVLEGGYNIGLTRALPATISTLLKTRIKLDTPSRSKRFIMSKTRSIINKLSKLLRSYWTSLNP